ncbi:MAG: hypothetical protein ACKVOJ_09795 [Sphingomonadaceae bacterium]
MRSVLMAIIALSFATPVVAAPANAERDMQDVAKTLNDPATQEAMSGALGAMMAALLDMRIDGIAKALEPMNGGKRIVLPGKTVRELATRDDPNFERKMKTNTRAMMGSMGAMASALATIIPQFEAAARKMEEALPKGQ